MANCLLQDGWFSSDRAWLVLSDRRHSLTITFEWHEEGTTSDQVMKTYLWNGGGYSQVDQRTVTSPTSDTTIVIPVTGDLSEYINNGEVRVQFKVGEETKSDQWTHHIDLLKITAAP